MSHATVKHAQNVQVAVDLLRAPCCLRVRIDLLDGLMRGCGLPHSLYGGRAPGCRTGPKDTCQVFFSVVLAASWT